MVVGVGVGRRPLEQGYLNFPKAPVKSDSEKVITRGFTVFSWYVRVTVSLVILALAPLLIAYLAVSLLLDVAKLRSKRGLGGAEGIQSERRDFVGKLFGRGATQFFVCGHVFVSNVVFFTLLVAAVLKIASPATATASIFKTAALSSLIPAVIAVVMSLAHYYFSGFFQKSSLFLLSHCCKQSWHDFEKVHDKAGYSVLDLMRRDQLDTSSVSMSSLSVLDEQLLYGVPTMLTAVCCYEYDLYTGQEQCARNMRAHSIPRPGQGSVNVHRSCFF